MWRSLLRLPPVAFVWGVVDTYNRLGVARAAAALAYFLILTLFPLLMCVNFFIGLLPLSPEDVFSALDSISPDRRPVPHSGLSGLCLRHSPEPVHPPAAGLPVHHRPVRLGGAAHLLQTMDELYQSAGSTACTAWSSACPFPCCFC